MPESPSQSLDAYKPSQIAALVESAGVVKARLPTSRMLTLAWLAGAFIALGALSFTVVMTGTDPAFGPARFLGGVVFSLGLILVIVGGAELFTGNILIVMAAIDRRISLIELARNWTIVYLGNFIGALALVGTVYFSGVLDGPSGTTAAKIALAKIDLSIAQLFFRGCLCNMLVCLAVWLTFAARTAAGKIFAIIWPISCFVLVGFEHSVANMYLIPQGMLAGAEVTYASFASNLLYVTLGNIVGGAGGVAVTYWLAYGPRTDAS